MPAASVLLARFGSGTWYRLSDLHEDVVVAGRQGRHGRGQAGVVRGAGGQAAAVRHRRRAGSNWR